MFDFDNLESPESKKKPTKPKVVIPPVEEEEVSLVKRSKGKKLLIRRNHC